MTGTNASNILKKRLISIREARMSLDLVMNFNKNTIYLQSLGSVCFRRNCFEVCRKERHHSAQWRERELVGGSLALGEPLRVATDRTI